MNTTHWENMNIPNGFCHQIKQNPLNTDAVCIVDSNKRTHRDRIFVHRACQRPITCIQRSLSTHT